MLRFAGLARSSAIRTTREPAPGGPLHLRRLARTLLTTGLAIVAVGCAPARQSAAASPAPPPVESAAETVTVRQPELRDSLLAMAHADQSARAAFVSAMQAAPADTAALAGNARAVAAADSSNLARLKLIVREHGWPDRRLVGADAAGAVFLLVQHADRDPAFQREYLAWLQRAFDAGELQPGAGEAIALLTDRVRTNEGRPQLYGTQVEIVDGKAVVKPIEDAANVDARRAALGLPPLDAYLARLRQFYGLEP